MKNVILLTYCFLIFGLYGQEREYILNTDYTKKIIAESKNVSTIFEIEEKILKHKKNAFIIKDTLHPNSLSGVFMKMGRYFMMNDTHTQYSKYELVSEWRIKELKVSEKHIIFDNYNTLIVNLDDMKFYFVTDNFLDKLDYTSQKKKLDRQAYIENNRKYKISKTTNITYPTKEFKYLLSECTLYTEKLKEHTIRAKKGNMTKTQIREWKKDIVAAKLLDYRISDFLQAYKMTSLKKDSNFVNPINEYKLFSKTLTVASEDSGL